ncbi:hypothetical protein PanWU01x14_263400, partial [Parasponia andersonii]
MSISLSLAYKLLNISFCTCTCFSSFQGRFQGRMTHIYSPRTVNLMILNPRTENLFSSGLTPEITGRDYRDSSYIIVASFLPSFMARACQGRDFDKPSFCQNGLPNA